MKKNILYVEDDLPEEVNQNLLWTLLTEEGQHEVSPARVGSEAENILKTTAFDLIILDIMMDAGVLTTDSPLRRARFFETGLTLLEALRTNQYIKGGTNSNVPVIVITATNSEERWERINRAVGADHQKNCFHKPHSIALIYKRIQEILDNGE